MPQNQLFRLQWMPVKTHRGAGIVRWRKVFCFQYQRMLTGQACPAVFQKQTSKYARRCLDDPTRNFDKKTSSHAVRFQNRALPETG